MAVAPGHAQSVGTNQMGIGDRKLGPESAEGRPRRLTAVTGVATGGARARPPQLLQLESADLLVGERHLHVGIAIDGDSGDVDLGRAGHGEILPPQLAGDAAAASEPASWPVPR